MMYHVLREYIHGIRYLKWRPHTLAALGALAHLALIQARRTRLRNMRYS